MSNDTKALGQILRSSNPAIYQSYGDLGCFSLRDPKPLSEEKSSAECVRPNIAPSSSFHFCAFPAPELTPRHALYDFSVEVSKVQEVKAVASHIENDIIRVWTFISKRDKAVRKSIYKKELYLMDKYPEMVFDFNVVSIRNFSGPFVPQNLHGSLSFYRNVNGD